MNRSKIEVFHGKDDWRWYWRVRASNSKIVAQSEGYSSKDNALRGASALRRAMILPQLKVVD